MPYRRTIAAAYNAGVEEEFNRLTENPLRETEYQLITELLDQYIANGEVVIDIGSGPGRYAEHLLNRNCKVGVVDLSAKTLKAFSDRMNNAPNEQNIMFNQISCATQLSWINSNSADAILLMGPLYHLINEKHRKIALEHCRRILRPGGMLFTVFLSPFPEIFQISESTSEVKFTLDDELVESGRKVAVTHTKFKGFQVPQFRCWPETAKGIMKAHSFEIIRIRNIEGKGTFIPSQVIASFNTPSKKISLLNSLRASSEIENTLGITHQYVTVSKKMVK